MTSLFQNPNVTFFNVNAGNGSADGFLSMPIEGLKIEVCTHFWIILTSFPHKRTSLSVSFDTMRFIYF
jgi:hypothetical protein